MYHVNVTTMMRKIYNEGYPVLEQFVQQEAVRHYFPGCKTRMEKQVLFVEFRILITGTNTICRFNTNLNTSTKYLS